MPIKLVWNSVHSKGGIFSYDGNISVYNVSHEILQPALKFMQLGVQGRNDGARGSNPQGAESLSGRRKDPTLSQKLSSIQHICYRRALGSNRGRQTCSLPRMPSNAPVEVTVASHGRQKKILITRLERQMLHCVTFNFWNLRNIAKFLVFNSIFVPILMYGHKSWVIKKKFTTSLSGRDEFLMKSHGLIH